jgi:hypothetical protein
MVFPGEALAHGLPFFSPLGLSAYHSSHAGFYMPIPECLQRTECNNDQVNECTLGTQTVWGCKLQLCLVCGRQRNMLNVMPCGH